MKVNWSYIKFICLFLLISGLFSFSNYRNGQKKIKNINIEIFNKNTPFITNDDVINLLKKNNLTINNQLKETLDLNEIESIINTNKTIKNAEVFLSISGNLLTQIHQKTPIARVSAKESFYIDANGTVMPLSKSYSARVPLVVGAVNKLNFNNSYELSKLIFKDEFLKSLIYEITQYKDETLSFKIRESAFVVELGKTNHLKKKLNNFKAFYLKAKKDNLLSKYSKVNLKFTSQVICSKK